MPPGGYITSQVYGSYPAVSATALCCYEYLLTFDAELKFVWRRRPSAGSVLFILNRYAMLVASLGSIVQVTPWFAEDMVHFHTYSLTCALSLRVVDICILIIYFSYAVFAAMRMYALYGKSKAALISVLLVAIVGPCAQSYFLVLEESDISAGDLIESSFATYQERFNCHVKYREAERLGQAGAKSAVSEVYAYLPMAVRLHSLLLEILLLCMTWNKTFTRSNLWAPGIYMPVTTVLLRDGTLYFMATAVIVALNFGGLAMSVHETSGDAATSSSKRSEKTDIIVGLTLLGPIVDMITSICMSRFLLNLLAAADGNYDTRYRSSRWDTVLRFAQVDTLGGPLRDTVDEDSNNENSVQNSLPLNDYDITRRQTELHDVNSRSEDTV